MSGAETLPPHFLTTCDCSARREPIGPMHATDCPARTVEGDAVAWARRINLIRSTTRDVHRLAEERDRLAAKVAEVERALSDWRVSDEQSQAEIIDAILTKMDDRGEELAQVEAERDAARLRAGKLVELCSAAESRAAESERQRDEAERVNGVLREALADLKRFVWNGGAIRRVYQLAATAGHKQTETELEEGRVLHHQVMAALASPAARTAPTTERIFRDVQGERARQDAKWGGPQHDDEHDPSEWVDFIVEHARGPVRVGPYTFRKQMVRVAALAIAAIESHDRKAPPAMGLYIGAPPTPRPPTQPLVFDAPCIGCKASAVECEAIPFGGCCMRCDHPATGEVPPSTTSGAGGGT